MIPQRTPPDDALLDLLEEQLALITAHFGYLPLVEGVSSDAVGDARLCHVLIETTL
jgi:hypothetical protein